MNNLIKDTLQKIKKDRIQPIPRWHFVLKKSFFWFLFGVMIVLGSFSFGIILLQINGIEWDIYRYVSGGISVFIMTVLPYFWVLIMCGFIALAYFHFKNSDTGYRFKPFIIVGGSILISVFFGGLLYATGLTEKVENVLRKVPYYERIDFLRSKMWVSPERGLLGGVVYELPEHGIMIIKDFRGDFWNVDYRRSFVRRMITIEKGIKLKILGEKIGDFGFTAYEIRPWDSFGREDGRKFPKMK